MTVATVVLLTTAVAVPALAGGTAMAQQNQGVDSCTTITEPGTYELDASIGVTDASDAPDANETDASDDTAEAADETNASAVTGANASTADAADASACIVVESDDVVFDGNGHVLDGDNASALNGTDSTDGANASTAENQTNGSTAGSVVNGIVVRPPADADTVSNVTIRDVTVRNWHVGVYVRNASGVTLDDVTSENNTVPGFRLVNSTDLSISTENQSTAQSTAEAN